MIFGSSRRKNRRLDFGNRANQKPLKTRQILFSIEKSRENSTRIVPLFAPIWRIDNPYYLKNVFSGSYFFLRIICFCGFAALNFLNTSMHDPIQTLVPIRWSQFFSSSCWGNERIMLAFWSSVKGGGVAISDHSRPLIVATLLLWAGGTLQSTMTIVGLPTVQKMTTLITETLSIVPVWQFFSCNWTSLVPPMSVHGEVAMAL